MLRISACGKSVSGRVINDILFWCWQSRGNGQTVNSVKKIRKLLLGDKAGMRHLEHYGVRVIIGSEGHEQGDNKGNDNAEQANAQNFTKNPAQKENENKK